jgi:hypothetical protein
LPFGAVAVTVQKVYAQSKGYQTTGALGQDQAKRHPVVVENPNPLVLGQVTPPFPIEMTWL